MIAHGCVCTGVATEGAHRLRQRIRSLLGAVVDVKVVVERRVAVDLYQRRGMAHHPTVEGPRSTVHTNHILTTKCSTRTHLVRTAEPAIGR